MTRYGLLLLALCSAVILHLHISSIEMSFTAKWQVMSSFQAQTFADFQFLYAALPRLVLATLTGAALALAGSLFQQLSQNSLVSPLTLGASSGAWLGLICSAVWFPTLAASYSVWFALVGALLATGTAIYIAGRSGTNNLHLILAGMAIHILLGAVATVIVLLNEQPTQNLFIWGAGDLSQTDWQWVEWLWPKLVFCLVVFIFSQRPLLLLRLGHDNARARGLHIKSFISSIALIALWLVASSITAVGVIAFIGLIAPNIARLIGAKKPRDELASSLLLGVILLISSDCIALCMSQLSEGFVPTGTMTALLGAPLLIYFAKRQLTRHPVTQNQSHFAVTAPLLRYGILLSVLMVLLLALIFFHQPNSQQFWLFALPDSLTFSLRWPKVLAVISVGAGIAVAGVILQRLVRNPLASPDILGITGGAKLAVVFSTLLVTDTIINSTLVAALVGSLAVLLLLICLGRANQYAANVIILIGIALSALIEGVIHFALAKGTSDVYQTIHWLAGSSYYVNDKQAMLLFSIVATLLVITMFTTRWLTLIASSDEIAAGRGVNLTKVRLTLLLLVALFCASTTALMGPIAFVGLLAPHIASLIGAHKAIQQIHFAILIGMLLMLFSEWFANNALYPQQIPVGTLVSIIGGSYFILLLFKQSHKTR